MRIIRMSVLSVACVGGCGFNPPPPAYHVPLQPPPEVYL